MTLQNSFNIHYQFNDVGHYMDAFIFNKCEYQLLGIILEVKKLVDADIEVTVQPLSEGSLWSRLSFSTKEGKEIKLNWVIALIIAITVNPLNKTTDNIIDWAFEYIKDGSYIHNLKLEKERLELEKEIRELREDSIKHSNKDSQNKLKRRVSNFYTEAKKDQRITSIGFCSSVGNPSSEQIVINRDSFDNFIINRTIISVNLRYSFKGMANLRNIPQKRGKKEADSPAHTLRSDLSASFSIYNLRSDN